MSASTLPWNTPLDSEISQLESELNRDARFVRLKQLKEMRENYLSLPPLTVPTQPFNLTAELNSSESRSGGRRRSPEREQALQETKAFLKGKTQPTRLSEIDAYLEAKGVRLGGADPLNNLSALLSTSDEFRAHGRAGWTLNE